MKFDARTDSSPEKKTAFTAWLLEETISTLRRSAGDPEGLKTAVFLYFNRAYEAGIPPDEVTDLLGVGPASAMSPASLSKKDKECVLAAFEVLNGLIEAVHSGPPKKAR
ncbi:MAG TPA: hypothetical protein VI454_02460 [Verrucomicrobiae bacterium]|jgi:hypothetical protein